MPRIHQYRDRRGLYIKARHGGRITTYQVTPDGARLLNGHGSHLSPQELQVLIHSGLVYTGGSGPGCLDPEPLPPPLLPPVESPPALPLRWPRRTIKPDYELHFLILLLLIAIC